MRACYSSALALAAAVVLSFGLAGDVSAQCDACGDAPHGCDLGRGGCGGCRNKCKGHHNKYLEGKDRGFNCGCNGSYNYPVPPLYVYHWPGMYKAERMTDYHSPWRFPPIKPFVDEVPVAPGEMTREALPSELQPITALIPLTAIDSRPGEPESMSAKLLKSFR